MSSALREWHRLQSGYDRQLRESLAVLWRQMEQQMLYGTGIIETEPLTDQQRVLMEVLPQ